MYEQRSDDLEERRERVVVPVERQVELVREFERIGLPGTRFAVMAGLKYQTLASWRRIGYHPACAGRWVSGGEPSVPDPLSLRPRATSRANSPRPPQKQLLSRRAVLFFDTALSVPCVAGQNLTNYI